LEKYIGHTSKKTQQLSETKSLSNGPRKLRDKLQQTKHNGKFEVSSHIRTLMMVPETSVSSCNQLTRLCAREDFIEFSRRESFKLYKWKA
jgi:hypothetical protein